MASPQCNSKMLCRFIGSTLIHGLLKMETRTGEIKNERKNIRAVYYDNSFGSIFTFGV